MKMAGISKFFTFALIVALSAVGGCRDKSTTPKAHTLKGRVTKIDAASGVVTGKFVNKKTGEDMDLSGKLAPDAEIMIDGRTANLNEVEIGDEVEVIGFDEKQDDDHHMIAKKVKITRSTPSTRPATRPAEATPGH